MMKIDDCVEKEDYEGAYILQRLIKDGDRLG